MADFKSDSIDIVSDLYASIPTGTLVPIAGPVSLYSNAAYVALGLLPCNGTVREIATYQNLYNILTNNGTVFPFGANTLADGITAGNTHFKLPNMLATKYFLLGSPLSNVSVSNNLPSHYHTTTATTTLTNNNETWSHSHTADGNTDSSNIPAHGHAYPSANVATSGPSNPISKNDASGPTAASQSHTHGSLNMNAGTGNSTGTFGSHSHGYNTGSSNVTDMGVHLHNSATSTVTFNSNTVSVYPPFVNTLYFVRA